MKLLSYGLDQSMEPRLAFSLKNYAVDVMRASLWMKEDRNAKDFLNLASSMKLVLNEWDRSLPILKQLEWAFQSIGFENLSVYDRPLALPEAEIVFFAPIPDPPGMRYFNAFDEKENQGFSFGNTQTLLGHKSTLRQPGLSARGEIAAIIAGNKVGSTLQIAGYCVANNWVDIKLLSRESEGLSCGMCTSLGPYLMVAETLEPLKLGKGFNLDMQIKVNGSLIGESRLKEMKFDFSEMMQAASRTNVQPGDIFLSGSPNIVREAQALKKNDQVDVEIQALGVLSTTIG
ncbi:fumarylacetoacetate hydrolase family protein [bacterium]|nr:fumarylacetoacetate hydrolase family protein [bacterium]